MPLSDKILSFLKTLDLKVELPEEVQVMNPFKDGAAFRLCERFYKKYYEDHNPRHLILGINPGRFGGGITGIPFTDPVRLQEACGIENYFQKKQELSSVFIYEIIHALGGPGIFYSKFYISATCPLGFLKNNKNMNYYDNRQLENSIKNFVAGCLSLQLEFGMNRDVVFCLGEGKNFTYLSNLNHELKFFNRIVPLPHPRFVMQYRLKRKNEYIARYLSELAMGER
jgi:hypothetical protein